jgi:hypothetical protein
MHIGLVAESTGLSLRMLRHYGEKLARTLDMADEFIALIRTTYSSPPSE